MSATENINLLESLPVLPLRGLVMFPGMILSVDVGRSKSVKAINFATNTETTIYAVTQKSIIEDYPKQKDLYPVGCISVHTRSKRAPPAGA